jgi:hypothetical protein
MDEIIQQRSSRFRSVDLFVYLYIRQRLSITVAKSIILSTYDTRVIGENHIDVDGSYIMNIII